ncbi:MAG: quinate 5-dehydrogenase [Coriobacteriia bacterium]|nr:quinate 5-dehydrogenase [Coriobacteriia bacterium]
MGQIKKVVSASLGSSKRDHRVVVKINGVDIEVSRQGTDGDLDALKALLVALDVDDEVAAIGLGGTDLFLNAAGKSYWLREMKPLAKLVTRKALVDGTGLKGAVEGATANYMQEDMGIDLAGKKVLITSAVDRWGIAMAFADAGAQVSYADLLYVLGIPALIHSRRILKGAIRMLAPIIIQLPFAWLYPAESDEDTVSKRSKRTDRFYYDNDIIVGDYKYVVKYMPDDLKGTTVVTNTTTPADLDRLRSCGVDLLVTTTPRLDGRSFGTNVMEALLVASVGATERLTPERYLELLKELDFEPDVTYLQ